MTSERMQRRIEAFLDQAEAASDASDWGEVAEKARAALAIEPESADARTFLAMAEANLGAGGSAASPAPAAVAVDPERVAELAAAAERSGNPLDRLEEGIFVGRTQELERLRAAFDEALERRGSVVMLVGEPGIGKTRTTQELDAYARTKGAQVFWGGAHETEGAPPYWPWVQLGRAYRDLNPEETRRREWEPYAVELQRIFALRTLFPNLPEPPAADSEEAQFRLFDAMTGFLRGVAERTPLLLVLDDLHWADAATLQLLAHVGREVGRARILVLGTYRDTDLDRRHPLSRTLAQMNREALFSRIALRGLTEPEVGDYLRRTAGIAPERALVHRIYEETEGNPFFLAQVVNLMAQEGTLTAPLADVHLPEGVREALGRRLDRLSDEANALLTTLAVVGRNFDHPVTQALSGHDAATTLGLIEEALRARVIEETGRAGEYRFTHALMQETLLGELSAARQVLLHGQIAEAFEALYGPDDRDHLAALANHYAESAVLNREHARLAVRYLRRAAEQAEAALGWEEAIQHYERCLALIADAVVPLGEDEAALWAALWRCRPSVGEQTTARAALARALALYAERGDARGAARPFADGSWGPSRLRAELPLLDGLIEALGDEDSVELCRLLAVYSWAELGTESSDARAASAEAMSLRLGLVGIAAPVQLTQRRFQLLVAAGAFREAAALMDSQAVVPGSAGAATRMNLRSLALAYAGEVTAWIASREEGVAEARTYRRRPREAVAVADLASIAWRRGERAQVERLLVGVDLGVSALAMVVPAAIALADGDAAAAGHLLPGDDHPATSELARLHSAALRVQLLFLTGDGEGARMELSRASGDWDRLSPNDRLGVLGFADVAFAAVAEEQQARAIAAHLEGVPGLRCYPYGGLGNPDVLRGALALRFGDLDAAEQHYRTGLEWASRPDVRFIVDQGRCLQGLAEVAERRGDIEAARAHLDAAGALFAQHGGARLYLDQVLAKKQVLRA